MKNKTIIILAAGEGKRLGTEERGLPKALETLRGKPFIDYALDLARDTGFTPEDTIVVVGHRRDQIVKHISGRAITVTQNILQAKGTASAVEAALPKFIAKNTVLVVYVDQCFFSPQIARDLLTYHDKHHADMTIMTVVVNNPAGFGRIVRDQKARFQAIVEEKDCSLEQKKIREINTGTCVFQTRFLEKYLPDVTPNPITNEYYLTDLAKIGLQHTQNIALFQKHDPWAAVGINTQPQLKQAEQMAQKKLPLNPS